MHSFANLCFILKNINRAVVFLVGAGSLLILANVNEKEKKEQH